MPEPPFSQRRFLQIAAMSRRNCFSGQISWVISHSYYCNADRRLNRNPMDGVFHIFCSLQPTWFHGRQRAPEQNDLGTNLGAAGYFREDLCNEVHGWRPVRDHKIFATDERRSRIKLVQGCNLSMSGSLIPATYTNPTTVWQSNPSIVASEVTY